MDQASLGDLLHEISNRTWNFYGSADASMIVASSVVSISILLTLGILSQGKKHTVFNEGLYYFKQYATSKEEEEETEEAENEIFSDGKVERLVSNADEGVDIFLNSSIPKLTAIMALIVLGGTLHVIANSDL